MDKRSYKILKKLYSAGYLPVEQFLALLGCAREDYWSSLTFEAISEYVQNTLLYPSGDTDSFGVPSFVLTPHGKAYVEERRSRFVRDILLIMFSGITAFATVAALFVK